MEANEKISKGRKQRFAIIILIIIIIILLSYLSYILGKIGNSPESLSQVSGDVFEVVEEKQNDNKTNTENEIIDTNTQENNIINTSNNNSNNQKPNFKIINYNTNDTNNNTQENNNHNIENNNIDNSNNNNNENNNNEDNNNNENNNNNNDNNDEQIKNIEVSDKNQAFGQGQQINIFKHTSKNVKNDKIAPLTKGTYTFDIKNGNNFAIKYQIKINEENPYNINMKYRLKLDGRYIIGDENTWVNINELNKKDLILANDSYAKFELDWYWDEGENDTFIGTQIQSKYKAYIEINAEKQ